MKKEKVVRIVSIKQVGTIILGAVIYSLSLNLFLAQNKVAPGGLSGLGLVLHHLTGMSLGSLIFLTNIPLFLIALRDYGKRFVAYSLLSVGLMSLSTDLIKMPCITDDLFLAGAFGGVVMGAGLGLVVRGGGNSGGTMLIARLLQRWFPHVSLAWMLFAIDFFVVALSGLVFTAEVALYALVALYTSTIMMDAVVIGIKRAKSAYVISSNQDAIACRILKDMERGVTKMEATGAFSGEKRGVLLCVLGSAKELVFLKELVKQEDPGAFLFISDVREVLGEGFYYMEGHG